MAGAPSLLDRVLDEVLDATRSGRSVLVQAAVQGHDDVLRCILHRSNQLTADPDLQAGFSKELAAAFLGAAEQGHLSCLTAILESGHDINDLTTARTEGGETALMLAAEAGQVGCITRLMQHNPGAQVAAADNDGATALTSAAGNGHAACVQQLLQHNPDAQVAAASSNGFTALMAAAQNGCAACVHLLLQHNPKTQVAAADTDGDTALILAAFSGNAKCIQQLLQHNPEAQVAAANRHGITALIAATWHGHAICIQHLLQHNPQAQLAAVDATSGSTAPAFAASEGHPQCLDLLLTHNIQQEHLDRAWLAALHKWSTVDVRASPCPHSECLERLLAKGAQPPKGTSKADRAKHKLFIRDLASRALVADRTNAAIVGLALTVSKKRKASQEEEQ